MDGINTFSGDQIKDLQTIVKSMLAPNAGDKRISALGAIPIVADTDLFAAVDLTDTVTKKATALQTKDYVNAGKAGGKTIIGGTLTTQTLTLYNNAIDNLGFDLRADGILRSNVPNYETLVLNDDDLTNKKYVDDQIAEIGVTHDVLTVSSPGKTLFTLSSTAVSVDKSILVLNGQVRTYYTDFTIIGTTLTWRDPGGVTLKTTDDFQIWYDIDYAPNILWERSGTDLTPVNVDDNVDMKKGKFFAGDGTDAAYTFAQYQNASAIKPILEFNPAIMGLSHMSGLRFYTRGIMPDIKSAAFHLHSEAGSANLYQTTNSALYSLERTMGRASTGVITSGTRYLWTEQYDGSNSDLRLFYRNDGTVRTRLKHHFAYDATSFWSSNNTNYAVAQHYYNDNDDIAYLFDCTYDGTNIKSSSTTGNVRLYKKSGMFQIDVDTGVAAGAAVSFNTAFSINTTTGNARVFNECIYKVRTDDISIPPTSGQLNTIFGATPGEGFTGYINDNGANLYLFQVMWSGGFWWYFQGAKVI